MNLNPPDYPTLKAEWTLSDNWGFKSKMHLPTYSRGKEQPISESGQRLRK